MPAPFRLYNSLGGHVEDFEPLHPGRISLYVCGMTVYDHAHVGHARAMVVFDTFVRWLRHRDWQVRFVRNFTDVDDKIIARASERGIDAAALAQRYIDAFHEDCEALGLLPPDAEPRVSDTIPPIIGMIQRLVEKGHAYEAGGSVWFHVASYPAYGRLSGQKPDEMRSSPDSGHKRDPRDFALWKAAKAGEPSWPSPWGPGRPGWHIECSAMTLTELGTTIDIHGGGLDLVFPHHENEIAQSSCANEAPYARYWMHNGLLQQGDAKMGKSLGNVVDIRDALREFPAEALRLYYVQAHYRSPLPWDPTALPDALCMLARLYEARELGEQFSGEGDPAAIAQELGRDALEVLQLSAGFEAAFTAALDEDFNSAKALGHAFELVRALNRLGNQKKARSRAAPIVKSALQALDLLKVLGLLTLSTEEFQEEVRQKRLAASGVDRAEVERILEERTTARSTKDWAAADALRQRLDALGIVVMDRPDGTVDWRVKLHSPAA